MNIRKIISKNIQKALIDAGVNFDCEVQVRPSTKIHFGDYQVNGIIPIAKQLGLAPYVLAEKVVSFLDLKGIASKVDIVNPGFINIFLDRHWLENILNRIFFLPRLGIPTIMPKTIVVDYSSPNIAKEMHVGHLRSTIIGDASVRILKFLGHNVIKANHVGDWGIPFGMLIAYLEEIKIQSNEEEIQFFNLENFYHAAKQLYDKDPIFAKKARKYVVKLQSGDKHCRKVWQKLVNITMIQNQKIYDRLNVTLTQKDVMGESLYQTMIPKIIADLQLKGLAVEKKGAILVFLKKIKNKEGKAMGVIIQKKDGAYLYATTDIACAKYRYETLRAERIIYYTDSRQHQHLMQVFSIVRKAGYVPESVLLEHHMFGMVFGKDGKPFKTRDGKTIKLSELLDEAIERARRLIATKNPTMIGKELEKVAKIVGIGAVKYADLSKNRTTNYIFDWNKMLNFDDNTAPYIQYAYARILSLFKRSDYNEKQLHNNIVLLVAQEIQLAVHLLRLEEIILAVEHNGTPHILCSYLYDVAVLFSSFYEHCPILKTKNEAIKQSRLKLALLTARTLKQGLDLLGIETVDRM